MSFSRPARASCRRAPPVPFLAGEGRSSTNASSSRLMPRLRVAAPQVTGKMRPSVTPVLSALDGLLVGDLLALEVALHQLVGDLGHLVHQLLAVLLRPAPRGPRGSRSPRGAATGRRRSGRPSCRPGRSRPRARARSRSGSRWPRRAGRRPASATRALRKKSARSRSSMFTKMSRARPSSSARCQRRSVVTSTPITPLTTNTAPSHTRSAASASARKLGSPGGVEQVDLAVVPAERREARGDRHLARLLVGGRVGDRRAVSHRAEPVDRARLEQERLVHGRLPAAPVADQGHVADPLRRFVRHPAPSLEVPGQPISPCDTRKLAEFGPAPARSLSWLGLRLPWTRIPPPGRFASGRFAARSVPDCCCPAWLVLGLTACAVGEPRETTSDVQRHGRDAARQRLLEPRR